MRQITLELLRHGPANNQLLSPLTQYLALCENHAAVTVRVPFEHNQFLHRLGALSYRLGQDARAFQIKDTARELGDLLGVIPGLIAELSRDPRYGKGDRAVDGSEEPQRLTHLRLIISASELALLPFELALAPNGFPGAGQHLLLQSQEPLCLTREVRRVAAEYVHWPKKPRILLVAAAPPDVGPVPLQSHLLALRRLIDPWVEYFDTDAERRARVDEHLVVLPNATVESLERACAEGGYTHIHILAHGVEYAEGYDIRFGLAFHDARQPDGPSDRVSGERLATILRATQKPDSKGLARPVVVTLASCNSGNGGTVAGMGASVAHALHEAGIPMVVAGQFPVSFEGSVLLVEVLYQGLLWGDDPRVSLDDLRRRLHSQFPTKHDWATFTAYASLPPEFERQLSEVQIHQANRSVNVAMNFADRATVKLMKRPRSSRDAAPPQMTDAQKAEILTVARSRMDAAKQRLEDLLATNGHQRARVYGLLASAAKRRAEVFFSFSRIPSLRSETNYREESYRELVQAKRHYWQTFLLDRSSSWAVVQYLSLDLVLRRRDSERPEPAADDYNNPEALWSLAHVMSLNDVRAREADSLQWAYGNLVELYLLGLLLPAPPPGFTAAGLIERAVQRARDLVDRAAPDSFAVYSTRRQILRYEDWYSDMAPISVMSPAVERVLDLLPESERQSWD